MNWIIDVIKSARHLIIRIFGQKVLHPGHIRQIRFKLFIFLDSKAAVQLKSHLNDKLTDFVYSHYWWQLRHRLRRLETDNEAARFGLETEWRWNIELS